MRESAHVAALRVALGKCLADLRDQNDLSQRELAERLYYDRTSISKIEAGQQPAPQAFWREADKLLGAEGKLAAMFDALTAAKASGARTAAPMEERRGGRPADVLADALTAAMMPVARTSTKIRSTSATSDQVDVVIELEALSRALAEHSRRVLMGEPADWAEITERLSQATTRCRHRVVIEPYVAANRTQS